MNLMLRLLFTGFSAALGRSKILSSSRKYLCAAAGGSIIPFFSKQIDGAKPPYPKMGKALNA
jgi:hypothetical protein